LPFKTCISFSSKGNIRAELLVCNASFPSFHFQKYAETHCREKIMEIFGYNEYHKHKHTALMSKLQNVVIQNSISNVIANLIFGEILLYSPDLEDKVKNLTGERRNL